MCRKQPGAATVIAGMAALFGLAVAAPAAAWPFGPAKPPPPATAAKAAGPQKASPTQRAEADRLDPLSRSAFWAHEADMDPTDTDAGVELAAALRLLGRFPEAQQAASRVLVIAPKDTDALLELARDYIDADSGFYALEPLRQAQALAPRDWRAYSLMGVAREQNRQPDQARAAYMQALALSPDNPAVLSNLALWCAAHGDRVQAEALLRKAVVQPGASAKVRQNLALVLGMEGKIGEAERLMREDLPPPVADNNLAYLQAVSGVPRQR